MYAQQPFMLSYFTLAPLAQCVLHPSQLQQDKVSVVSAEELTTELMGAFVHLVNFPLH